MYLYDWPRQQAQYTNAKFYVQGQNMLTYIQTLRSARQKQLTVSIIVTTKYNIKAILHNSREIQICDFLIFLNALSLIL